MCSLLPSQNFPSYQPLLCQPGVLRGGAGIFSSLLHLSLRLCSLGLSAWECTRWTGSPLVPDSPRTRHMAAGSELSRAPTPPQPPGQGLWVPSPSSPGSHSRSLPLECPWLHCIKLKKNYLFSKKKTRQNKNSPKQKSILI